MIDDMPHGHEYAEPVSVSSSDTLTLTGSSTTVSYPKEPTRLGWLVPFPTLIAGRPCGTAGRYHALGLEIGLGSCCTGVREVWRCREREPW